MKQWQKKVITKTINVIIIIINIRYPVMYIVSSCSYNVIYAKWLAGPAFPLW